MADATPREAPGERSGDRPVGSQHALGSWMDRWHAMDACAISDIYRDESMLLCKHEVDLCPLRAHAVATPRDASGLRASALTHSDTPGSGRASSARGSRGKKGG